MSKREGRTFDTVVVMMLIIIVVIVINSPKSSLKSKTETIGKQARREKHVANRATAEQSRHEMRCDETISHGRNRIVGKKASFSPRSNDERRQADAYTHNQVTSPVAARKQKARISGSALPSALLLLLVPRGRSLCRRGSNGQRPLLDILTRTS